MNKNRYQIPNSIMKASREEIDELELEILKQENNQLSLVENLPDDLSGYVLIAAPLPYGDGSFVLNGDGMIYRLDLTEGKAKLKTRIAKTPCYYADLAIKNQPEKYPDYFKFKNGGPSRMSLFLGSRNQLNTAFLKTSEQLFVTFDAGRPYEIDPSSLEILEPIGNTKDWKEMFPISDILGTLFGTYLNPAHPVIDVKGLKEELFTINYSTGYKGTYRDSIYNTLSSGKSSINEQNSIKKIIKIINSCRQLFHIILKILTKEFTLIFFILVYLGCDRLISLGRELFEKFSKIENLNLFTENIQSGYANLICYDFETKKFKSLKMILPSGKVVSPDQTIHQMAITKDYIIFMDIAFKIELSQILYPFWSESINNFKEYITKKLNNLCEKFQFFKDKFKVEKISSYIDKYADSRFLRPIPPKQYTNLYIVDRKLLSEKLENNQNKIEVKKTTIEHEVSHFVADYCNPENKIILHVGHNNGSDVTEPIRKSDLPFRGHVIMEEFAGMFVGTTDLGSLHRYVIDAETGVVINDKNDKDHIQDSKYTWSPSVYTHRELCNQSVDETADTVKNIYWMSWGFSWETIPERIYKVYQNGRFRHIHHTQLPEDYKPTQLLRLDTEKMEIVDSFEFPYGHFACTPQFIPSSLPCPENKEPSIHGYIVCVVLADNPENPNQPQDEFWILHADDFNNKPVYRLRSPKLDLGLTIHSTWLEDINKENYSESERRQKREKSVYEDYTELIKKRPKIKELFEECVYSNFIQQTSEVKFRQQK